jgi:hypothetical protein
MKTMLLVNGFDLSMLNGNPTVRFQKMTLEEVKKGIAEYKPVSTIVSAEYAELLSKELGIYITPSIRKPEMNFNTSLLIADIKTKNYIRRATERSRHRMVVCLRNASS